MTPQAWICPRCNRVWAPWIDGCPKCNDNHTTAPAPTPQHCRGKRHQPKPVVLKDGELCKCGHYLTVHEDGKCKAHGCKCSKSGA